MDEVKTVVSRDGTPIAYARYGAGAAGGPAVVLVGGGPGADGGEVPLARLLARSHPVYVYDRRGHGGSGYAIEREVEDLAAVLAAAGPGAAVHGTGTGGVLALAAAAAGVPVTAVSVFEPPYDGLRPVPEVHARVLVVDGGASPAPVRRAARELTARLPRARHRTLTGQTHEVAPHVLAPVLAEFVAELAE
ncbi:alpha/beta fold hydrolase [Streptomyces sp. R302]|uniref:alpha/beta fold hydrolase n=1 Tax=unclassified Streptomyces TaxID=2593676 RepID=UPI00145CF91D|nr:MULTISPECIES: alpha/beta fold hydrolase [unclassified Streptomyces]NML53392.1 alpha/beta fold hydrolase [Streptomyces sp. R301]NML78346.1 alpha/beta fold hydrolase [Streptomyces sp. R302]